MAEPVKQLPTSPRATPPSKRRWHVLVRHSPFQLKQLVVEAHDEAEAKELFLAKALAHHEKRAKLMRGQDLEERRKKLLAAFEDGEKRSADLDWCIRPAEEAEAAAARLKAKREGIWAQAEAVPA